MFEKLREAISGLISKVSTVELKPENLREILWEFKLMLIENDVALAVAERICNEIESKLSGLKVGRFEDKRKIILGALRETLLEILETTNKVDLIDLVEKKRSIKEPCIVVFVGINGTGKTTTIAKIANLLLKKGYSVVLACSDTFRAGSIEQLEQHARRLGVHMVKHKYGSDAAAVAYDAVQYAKARGINAVLIDTAGRMQTNKNLMAEMEKIARTVKPDLIIFVGDALTGNDAIAQAEEFNKYVDVSGSILTKMDADAKGGAAISIAYVTKKPILFLGTGQKYDDIEPFNPERVIDRILGTSQT
ncbi:MAG: signal recognition particle-docking protein FtsY [Candidatus Bathyarchaeia archaeon]|nr:signal recognition particle-docking protein FtsY [Candidatus Bathyarchaeota archaeon]